MMFLVAVVTSVSGAAVVCPVVRLVIEPSALRASMSPT